MLEFRICKDCQKITPQGTKCYYCGGSVELKEPHFFIGKSFGKYKIEGILGQGGMGVVFLARHSILGRLSALKLIIPDLAGDSTDTFIERFLREAQLLAGLKHPNIVDIYDFDISDYGLPYYAMEYVEGVSLRNFLASESKHLNVNHFSEIFKEIASALDYSHKKGIVHRDLKPENIMLTVSENKVIPKIFDFGIAKILTEEKGKTLTGEGNIIGTLNYIAPEQILGGKILPQTDQYALALIVAEIISGKILREGKTLGEIISKDFQQAIGSEIFPSSTSEAISFALYKATSKEPLQRYETISDFVLALNLQPSSNTRNLVNLIERKIVGVSPTLTPQSSKEILSQLSAKKTEKTKVAAQPEKSPQKKKPLLIFVYFLFPLIVISLFSYFLFFKINKEDEKAKDFSLCEKTGEWKVPLDSASILSSMDGNSILLKGAKSIYFSTLSEGQIPSSFPIEKSEEIIGANSNNEAILLKDKKIIKVNYEENKENVILDYSNEKVDLVCISRTTRTLALGKSNKIEFYSIFFEKPQLITSLSLDFDVSSLKTYNVSDKYFAFLAKEKIVVYNFFDSKPIFDFPFVEVNVYSIFIDDSLDYIALWGWFDRIALFSLSNGINKNIQISGEPKDLLIIPDRPTIVICGTFGIRFIDFNSSETLFEDSNEGKTLTSLAYSPKGILSLSKEKSSVSMYKYRTLSPEKIVKVCDKALWAITRDNKNDNLYLGGSDGKIYAVDKDGLITKKDIHTLGVTALVVNDNLLISSSDDKSIAVFKLPSLEVEYRSTAHKYLINYLTINKSTNKLWSSSSDGFIKGWSIPTLQEYSSFSLSEILKSKLSLHALWVSPDEKKFVIGTWNHQINIIDKNNDETTIKTFKIPSFATLAVIELKKVNVLIILGCYDTYGVYLLDLTTDELFLLSQLGSTSNIFSGYAADDGSTVYLSPWGEIVSVKFEKEKDNSISFESSLFVLPETESSSVMMVETQKIVCANSTGELIYILNNNLKSSLTLKGEAKQKIACETIKVKI